MQPKPGQILTVLMAKQYVERLGWSVFPLYEVNPDTGDCACPKTSKSRDGNGGRCGAAGKHPRTPRGVTDATVDIQQIERWWKHAPMANIGVATGAKSGIVVVDIDPRNGGDNSLAELLREHGELPDTPMALTGGGGQHYLFRWPGEDGNLHLTQPGYRVIGRPLAQGIDIKSDGGYIVVAPSTHISGRTYEWEATCHPNDIPIAALPNWISERLTRKGDYKKSNQRVTDGWMGAAFQAAGWLRHGLGPDKAAVRCPWEDDHTSGGAGSPSSTVVYAPMPGKTLGWFHCSHEHCRGRTYRHVMEILPQAAKDAANAAVGQQNPEDVPPEDPTQPLTWESSLRRNAEGRLTKDPGNVALMLANYDNWRGCLVYDEFADSIRWDRPTPTIEGFDAPRVGDEISDNDIVFIQHWFATKHGVSCERGVVADAVALAARQNKRHPVRDYLSDLRWDGAPRLESWLSTYLGAEPSEYASIVGRLWMVSAVARISRPGCQADHVLILEGIQGGGKSTAARTLAVRHDWFCGSLPDLRSKDAALQLAGSWICEIGELDALRGASGTRVKDFITQTIDTYRPPYGRNTVKRARQCVFMGTTNEASYLRDVTGARRFWPVQCRALDREALERDRDQLWAEAKRYFDDGAPWWPSRSESLLCEQEQSDRFEEDEWESLVAGFLRRKDDTTVSEILGDAIRIEPGKWTRLDQMRVAQCLRRLGWEKHRTRHPGERSVRWFSPELRSE